MLIPARHALPGHHGTTSGPAAAVRRGREGRYFQGKHWKLPPWKGAHGATVDPPIHIA